MKLIQPPSTTVVMMTDNFRTSPSDLDDIEATTSFGLPRAGRPDDAVIPADKERKTTLAPAVPDGGWMAWWQCVGAFCIFCNTWGLLNTFGVYQAYYQDYILSGSSPSQISWIGTVQTFFILFGAIWAGPLYDRGYLRTLLVVGSFMLVFGTFMNSICHRYWQVLLAQGFFIGIGLSCLFIPTPGVLSSYFLKRRALALGIAASGSSIGGIIYPTIFSRLVNSDVGFGWAVRVQAFVILAIQIPAVVGLKMRTRPAVVRQIFDITPWKEAPYTLWAWAWFFTFLGLYIPYFYIQVQSQEQGLVTGDTNFYLLPIMNAAGFFGRIIIGWLGDYYGPMNAYTTSCAICTLLLFAQLAIHSYSGVIAFAVTYGFFSGAIASLTPTVVAISLTPDLAQFATRWTMMAVPPAIGLLCGNPIAGAVVTRGYDKLQIVSGTFVAVATVLAAAARICKVGWGLGKC